MVKVRLRPMTENVHIEVVKIRVPIRLIVHGGARSLGDNVHFSMQQTMLLKTIKKIYL